MQKIFFLLFILLTTISAVAQQQIGKEAKKWASEAGIHKVDSSEIKILKVLKLFSSGFLFKNAEQFRSTTNTQPIPPGGTHPYEWDSIRTSEEMLGKCEGGYCGTFALSTAAILRAGGINSDDIRIVGAVNATDYLQICPGAKGSEREATPRTGASGHVYILVRINGIWKLINTTHHPFRQPINKESPAVVTYDSLKSGCIQRFDVKEWPSRTLKPDPKFLECMQEAEKEGMRRLTLSDFEIVAFSSREVIDRQMAGRPVEVPVESFPSLANWMKSENLPPKQIIFDVWSFEEYPKHTFQDRLNLVASGEVRSRNCRWNASQVRAILQRPQTVQPTKEKESESKAKSAK